MSKIIGKSSNRPSTALLNSKFKKHSIAYWDKASNDEKIDLRNWYLNLIEQGFEAWNKWSEELEQFITSNNIRRSDLKINLDGATIESHDFSFFVFPVQVSLSCTFSASRTLLFYRTEFKRIVQFNNVQFKKEVDFSSSQFKDMACFKNCDFHKLADFSSCVFDSSSYFNNSKFYDHAIFAGSKFNQDSYFKDAEFNSNANFNDVEFSYSRFFNSAFKDNAQFRNAKFLELADFANASFGKICNFEGAEFIHDVPEFNFCEFKQPPYLSRMQIPELYPTGSDTNTEKYRRLKSLAITSHDHEQELKFFSYEMKSKMENAAHRQSTRTYTPIRLYELTSSFGRSIGRPIVCLLGLWVVSLILHYVTLSPTTNCESDSAYSKEVAVMSYVSSHSFPLFLSDKRAKKATDDCLFGKEQPPSLIIQFVGFFQSLLSTVFAFLIGLGIRNRFKIRD